MKNILAHLGVDIRGPDTCLRLCVDVCTSTVIPVYTGSLLVLLDTIVYGFKLTVCVYQRRNEYGHEILHTVRHFVLHIFPVFTGPAV